MPEIAPLPQRKSMGCGASTAARVGPEPTEIIEALDSSTDTKATLSARLNGSLCLAPALRPVLESSASMISVGSGPTRAAVLAPQPMDLRASR